MKRVVLDNLNPDELSRLLDESNQGVILHPKGNSMLPFIRQGRDKVALGRPVNLKKGDIVLAWLKGRYFLHRVYALDGEKITLMGDGNLHGTECGTTADVKAVVTEIITKEGRGRKPRKAWLWRHTLCLRKYQMKVYRKWHKLMNS